MGGTAGTFLSCFSKKFSQVSIRCLQEPAADCSLSRAQRMSVCHWLCHRDPNHLLEWLQQMAGGAEEMDCLRMLWLFLQWSPLPTALCLFAWTKLKMWFVPLHFQHRKGICQTLEEVPLQWAERHLQRAVSLTYWRWLSKGEMNCPLNSLGFA